MISRIDAVYKKFGATATMLCTAENSESRAGCFVRLEDKLIRDSLSFDLRATLKEVSAMTGEVTNEDVLDSIFSRFCIGQ